MNNSTAAGDFLALAKSLMLAGGSLTQAAAIAETTLKNTRAASILKAAVEAGGTADPTWAGNLLEHRTASAGFVGSLQSISAFDALLPDMRKMPMQTRIAVVSASATGSTQGEGKNIPVSKMELAAGSLEPQLASALIVLAEELVRSGTADGDALIAAELRKAASAATNRAFLAALMFGAVSYSATGTDAASVYADLGKLAAATSPSGTSKLYLIVDPGTAASLAFKTITDGLLAFPDMTPSGGSVGGVPVLVSDEPPQDSNGSSVLMVDADAIAAGDAGFTLDSSKAAALQMDDSPVDGAANLTSMFQTHSVALRANRWFAAEKLRGSACAFLTDVNW
jgi:HK97 family phage major capsid protein